jgi:hypothetical protein
VSIAKDENNFHACMLYFVNVPAKKQGAFQLVANRLPLRDKMWGDICCYKPAYRQAGGIAALGQYLI